MQYFLPFLLIVPTIASMQLGGFWIFVFPPLIYALLILADLAVGETALPNRPAPHWLNALPTWLWVPLQFGVLAWALWDIRGGRFTPEEAIGIGMALGLATGGVGITDAHELVHRRARWERFLGQALLVSVTYHHFYIEHVFGHHRRAGTPVDSVTARRGEWLHAFLPRAIGRSFLSAWGLEAERLRRVGRSAGSLRNRVLAGVVAEAALYAGVAAFAGWVGVVFFAMQSLIAVLLLETINYVEHYGLARRETAPGVYERYGAAHAWDSRFRFSNWLLFNLPNHANHHLHPGRRHDELVYEPAAPRLPMGYPLAVVLAVFPPLWFRAVDPRLPQAGCAAARASSSTKNAATDSIDPGRSTMNRSFRVKS
ncbi:MAG TPA: alkane 1-monooxygenase [Alphaproteobacteria bacterium]